MTSTILHEQWRQIAGYEGFYEVSNRGRVRSVRRIVTHCNGRECRYGGRVLKATPDNAGYPTVGLSRDGISATARVHILVLTAFIGPCPEGCQGSHLDGDPGNNKIGNLYWESIKSNLARRSVHQAIRSERHGNAKLTKDDVLAIRALLSMGFSQKEIAKDLGVHNSTISRIKSGKDWGWLS